MTGNERLFGDLPWDIVDTRLPMNEFQALMEAKPMEEPREINEELNALRDVVATYVDQLEPRDLWIINAYMTERLSLQQIADQLGITKTHVWRLRNQAFDKLKSMMEMDTNIRKKIPMANTWEQAAAQWVNHISQAKIASTNLVESLTGSRDMMRDCVVNDDIPSSRLFIMVAELCLTELRKQRAWDSGEMVSLLCKKQHDYGHGNINSFGMYGIVVRLSDKVERYANLKSRNSDGLNEPITDTLLDIIGYCVIAVMFNEGSFQLQLGEEYVNRDNK